MRRTVETAVPLQHRRDDGFCQACLVWLPSLASLLAATLVFSLGPIARLAALTARTGVAP
jgi:hypothetical protein